jgi:uncharacterized peroxidase-related enzyme
MAKLPLTEFDDASTDVQALYLDFQKRMGFPMTPNFMKVQGQSVAAAGTWGLLQHVLLGGLLPRPIKEMMIAAISRDRECRYCEAAHLACCRMLGVDSATLQALVENVAELTPEKLRDIIVFGIKCARTPQALNEDDFGSLRRHGLREPEIMELISMAALAVYLNIIADATGVEPDDLFFAA